MMETTWIIKDQLCRKGIFQWNSQTMWLSDFRGSRLLKKENGIRKRAQKCWNTLKVFSCSSLPLTHPIFEQEGVPYKHSSILFMDFTNTEDLVSWTSDVLDIF